MSKTLITVIGPSASLISFGGVEIINHCGFSKTWDEDLKRFVPGLFEFEVREDKGNTFSLSLSGWLDSFEGSDEKVVNLYVSELDPSDPSSRRHWSLISCRPVSFHTKKDESGQNIFYISVRAKGMEPKLEGPFPS